MRSVKHGSQAETQALCRELQVQQGVLETNHSCTIAQLATITDHAECRLAADIAWTYNIHCSSVDTSATQGLLTCFALVGNCSSSHAGSETIKKLTCWSRSNSNLRLSLSCSAKASFCTSCSMNSAFATTANHLTYSTNLPMLSMFAQGLVQVSNSLPVDQL